MEKDRKASQAPKLKKERDLDTLSDAWIERVLVDYTLENKYVEPKNGGLEDYLPFPLGDFYGPCSFSGMCECCTKKKIGWNLGKEFATNIQHQICLGHFWDGENSPIQNHLKWQLFHSQKSTWLVSYHSHHINSCFPSISGWTSNSYWINLNMMINY